jgi:hypothetical protein
MKRTDWPKDLMGGNQHGELDSELQRIILETETGTRVKRAPRPETKPLQGDDYQLTCDANGYPELPACLDRRPEPEFEIVLNGGIATVEAAPAHLAQLDGVMMGRAAYQEPWRLMAVDPLTPVNQCMPGFADLLEGRFEPAVEPYRRMFEMDAGNPMTRLFYIWVLLLSGHREPVAALVASFPAEVQDTVPARLASFMAHALAGNADGVRASLTPAIEAAATATELFPRILAQGYAVAGMADRALYWLEIAIARGFINYPFLARHDPFLAGLRADPRFQQLMDVTRGRWEAFEP